jgi:uncharacterized repeat protein (TIGR01451 family)
MVADIDGDHIQDVVIGSSYAIFKFSFDLLPFGAALVVDRALAQPGDALSYTIALSNLSGQPLTISVTDTLAAYTTYAPASAVASAGVVLGEEAPQWQLTLEPGAQATLTFSVTVDAAAPDGLRLTNRALVDAAGLLVPRVASTVIDAAAPTTIISSPRPDELLTGTSFLIIGTASDTTSGVARVELSIEDGPWTLASGSARWSYQWTLPQADKLVTLRARAIDKLGRVQETSTMVTVMVDNLSPRVVSVVPAHGAQDVAPDAPVVITFSEPVVTTTLTFICQPNPGGWQITGNAEGQVVTLSHAAFASDMLHSCYINDVQDRAGHALVDGPAYNPWGFYVGVPDPGEVILPNRVYLPQVDR